MMTLLVLESKLSNTAPCNTSLYLFASVQNSFDLACHLQFHRQNWNWNHQNDRKCLRYTAVKTCPRNITEMTAEIKTSAIPWIKDLCLNITNMPERSLCWKWDENGTKYSQIRWSIVSILLIMWKNINFKLKITGMSFLFLIFEGFCWYRNPTRVAFQFSKHLSGEKLKKKCLETISCFLSELHSSNLNGNALCLVP